MASQTACAQDHLSQRVIVVVVVGKSISIVIVVVFVGSQSPTLIADKGEEWACLALEVLHHNVVPILEILKAVCVGDIIHKYDRLQGNNHRDIQNAQSQSTITSKSTSALTEAPWKYLSSI
jgi:hypothetical protein